MMTLFSMPCVFLFSIIFLFALMNVNIASNSTCSINDTCSKPEDSLFNDFKITNFQAELHENYTKVILRWNITKNNQPSKRPRSDIRSLEVNHTFKSGSQPVVNISIRMGTNATCLLHNNHSASCNYTILSRNIEICNNYQVFLGNKKNSATFTTVPINTESVKFEVTNDDSMPGYLTWDTNCQKPIPEIVPITLSISNSSDVIVDYNLNATCGDVTPDKCSYLLNNSMLHPCIYQNISLNRQVNLTVLYYPGIQNLLKNSSALIVDKDKLQLKLEVNPDFSQCTRYLKSIEVNLSRNSILHTFSDPFSSKNNLTISKIPFDLRCFKDIEVSVRPVWDNASTGLRDQKVYWNNSALKLILNKSTGYNFTHQGSIDIKNLSVVNISSTGFSIAVTISNYCKDTLSDELNEHRLSVMGSERISLIQLSNDDSTCGENQQTCIVTLKTQSKLEPCFTYSVIDHNAILNVTTLPGAGNGKASYISATVYDNQSAILHWDKPRCRERNHFRWQLWVNVVEENKIGVSLLNNGSFTNDVYHFELKVDPCKTYRYSLVAVWDQHGANDDYVITNNFTVKCYAAIDIAIPGSLCIVLLVVLLLLGLWLWKNPGKKETKKCNENPPLDSRVINSSASMRTSTTNSSKRELNNVFQFETGLNHKPVTDVLFFNVEHVLSEFLWVKTFSEEETKHLKRTAATRVSNKIKNRFANTQPFDFNRVTLSTSDDDDSSDDYINASFIPGYSGASMEYIAAQGPKENTLNDFWQMIWEQNVLIIAMLTGLKEGDKQKCEQYWPEMGLDLTSYGGIQVRLIDEVEYSFFTERKLIASNSTGVKRKIKQFHFTVWQDFLSPEEPEDMIQFIELIRKQSSSLKTPSPILVHCSAGVGRTGTLIAIDHLIQQAVSTGLIDIQNTVRRLRHFRLSMVQSEEQYVFLYECIAHFAKTRLGLNNRSSDAENQREESPDYANC